MAYTIIGKSPSIATLDEAYNVNGEFKFHEPQPTSIMLHAGADEMIRVDPNGFYVRGVRVPADDREAETVYNAFKQWLTWATLQQQR
jgi:hypothetical protein